MAGDIKGKYGTSASFTVTNLHSLATSADWTAGWTSAGVDSAADSVIDYQLGFNFASENTNRQAGSIKIYIYAALNDTPTWPDLFSSGTEGTEGAATVHSIEARAAGCKLLQDILCNSTASAVFTFSSGIAHLFNQAIVPQDWAIFVAHNISSTGAGIESTGSTIHRTPILAQYT